MVQMKIVCNYSKVYNFVQVRDVETLTSSADGSGVRAGPRDGLTRVHTAAVSIAVIVQRRRIFNLI